MADALPKLDRERLLNELLAEAERTVNEVADAVDDASTGRLIRDSEEPARDALDRFRVSLGDWLYAMLNWPTADWRDQLYLFVEHTRYYGLEIEPESIDAIRNLVEARVHGTGAFARLGAYGGKQPASDDPVQLAMQVTVEESSATAAAPSPTDGPADADIRWNHRALTRTGPARFTHNLTPWELRANAPSLPRPTSMDSANASLTARFHG